MDLGFGMGGSCVAAGDSGRTHIYKHVGLSLFVQDIPHTASGMTLVPVCVVSYFLPGGLESSSRHQSYNGCSHMQAGRIHCLFGEDLVGGPPQRLSR